MMIPKSIDPKRQAIIDAATRMFLAHGYRNVSMDKIAQAAPVSKATLYNHFDSKNALLAAVVSTLCTSLLQTMSEAVIESDDIEKHLKKIAVSFMDLLFSEDGMAGYRLFITESRDFPELGQLAYESGALPALTGLENYLRRLNADGHINVADTEFAANAFFNLLKGDLYLPCLFSIRPLPSTDEKNRVINQVIPFYMQGILHADQ
ncbi:TetR/AcrR family transcriptional regulator [Methylobacter sp. YRD-M1]|uniref:TetR/AcrR family transcriptional regulator n=1 Tax=Methylobacter sp. YRD-M1 TaxID=2911520 RepID=UPI00227CCA43|nr:TetR/AcrR family transcriptional regulator [Methylobacter sp. YRD-M1]WAK01535.1 TetR/AcrR family transcriptional regulator [Methylobacter sp. YRD-M1]